MRAIFVLVLSLLINCYSTDISPHTKKGQSRITLSKVHTPYYVTYYTNRATVPLSVKWDGPVNLLNVEVYFIIRPTTDKPRFPIFSGNLLGNRYVIYSENFKVSRLSEFNENLLIFQRGYYQVKTTIKNDYWNESLSSHFSVK
tara:strand:+ start:1116 stop:1544 length:429 start_codon:yes stop_codon:yes gene_type:complete